MKAKVTRKAAYNAVCEAINGRYADKTIIVQHVHKRLFRSNPQFMVWNGEFFFYFFKKLIGLGARVGEGAKFLKAHYHTLLHLRRCRIGKGNR